MKKLRLLILFVTIFAFAVTLCSCSTKHYIVADGHYVYNGDDFVLGNQIVEKFEIEFLTISESSYDKTQGVNSLRVSNPNRGARSYAGPFVSVTEDWCFSVSLKIQVYGEELTQYDVVFKSIDDLNFLVSGQNEFLNTFGVNEFKLRFTDSVKTTNGYSYKVYEAVTISIDLKNIGKNKFTESFALHYVEPNDK